MWVTLLTVISMNQMNQRPLLLWRYNMNWPTKCRFQTRKNSGKFFPREGFVPLERFFFLPHRRIWTCDPFLVCFCQTITLPPYLQINPPLFLFVFFFVVFFPTFLKVHIFWEGHKIDRLEFLQNFEFYSKVTSSNTSHASFFRLLMKGIFDPYVKTGYLKTKEYPWFLMVKHSDFFLTCIFPDFICHEITKEFWKNNHFENMTVGFLHRRQNSLRQSSPEIMHFHAWKILSFTNMAL